jgi:hypothetical protein
LYLHRQRHGARQAAMCGQRIHQSQCQYG